MAPIPEKINTDPELTPMSRSRPPRSHDNRTSKPRRRATAYTASYTPSPHLSHVSGGENDLDVQIEQKKHYDDDGEKRGGWKEEKRKVERGELYSMCVIVRM
jgi:hypothetical protein